MHIIFKPRYIPAGICLSLILLSSIQLQAQTTTDSTAADSALLQQVEQQMQQSQTQPQTDQPSGTQTRSSLSFNPDIGVIGDFQASYISKGQKNFDMYLNETEISLQATVDPYARADFFVSFGRDPDNRKIWSCS